MKKLLPLIGLFFFSSFSLLSFLVSKDIFNQLDFNATVKIQDRFQNSLVEPFSLFSLLGSIEIASMILLIILLFIRKLKSIFVLFFYFLLLVIELFGKVLIEQKGPPIMFLKTHLPFQFPSSYIPHEFFSYPSGHAARTAFISTVLLFILWKSSKLNKSLKLIFAFCILIFDFLMFLSRIYLGEHWSTDVVGGALLGFSLAILVSYFIKSLNPKKN